MLNKLKAGLKKTREGIKNKLQPAFSADLNENFLEELEEILISADISVMLAVQIAAALKEKNPKVSNYDEFTQAVKNIIIDILPRLDYSLNLNRAPGIFLITGVNGSGKTTSIGKFSFLLQEKYKQKVITAAADTFRAAAIEQLKIWGERTNTRCVASVPDGDPAAVVFDALKAARAGGYDSVLIDTAGRLHTKQNLMEELKKINKVINKEYADADADKFIVIDANFGQNAVNQVKMFNEAVGLTGVIVTKLDGTAKGGAVLSVLTDLKIPVKLIGVGEGVEDLKEFDVNKFVDGLF